MSIYAHASINSDMHSQQRIQPGFGGTAGSANQLSMSHFSSPDKMNYMQQQKMNQQTPNQVAMDRNDPSLLNCESPAGIPHSNGGSPPSTYYMGQKQAHMSDNVGMRRINAEQAQQAVSPDQRLVPSMMNSMQTPPQYAENRQQLSMKEF